jgi:PAS domain-containing protein
VRDGPDPMNQLIQDLRAAGDLPHAIGTVSMQRMADAFSIAGHPVALLGRGGAVIHMNARFEGLIGSGLLARGGRLGSWHPDADSALAAAIERAVSHHGPESFTSVVLPRQGGPRPLVAKVVSVVRLPEDV